MNIHISHAHNLIFQKFLQIYVVYGEYINNNSIQHTHTHTPIPIQNNKKNQIPAHVERINFH